MKHDDILFVPYGAIMALFRRIEQLEKQLKECKGQPS